MATVVMAAFGSRGDVAPLTAIGCRLQEAGHQVVLAAPSEFRDLIAGCGLRSRPIDVDLGAAADPTEVNPRRAVLKVLSPTGMRAIGEALLDALRDEEADVLMLSPFAELAGHPLAESRGIPSIGVRLQPLSGTADHPPALMGSWSAGSLGNRAAGGLATTAVERLYAGTVAGFRHRLGLPDASARALRRRRTAAGWPVLHGFSPCVVPRPADWRPGLDVVGYWWPPRPVDWRPPAEVVSFLGSGPPPVFLGFGSLMMPRNESARVSELVLQALRRAGVRGIVQAGWAGLHATSDDVLTIGDVPHDWLFDQVAAVGDARRAGGPPAGGGAGGGQACGAGTTAAGLRAGVPAVAIPEPGGDQPFWARRLRELRACAATLSRRTLTADRLAAAVDSAVTDASYRRNAERVAARIAGEDGAGRAVAAVERLLV